MSESSDRKTATIRALLERYKKLPRRTAPASAAALAAVRQVQVDALRTAHKAPSARKDYAALVSYYIENLHSGVDLERVVTEGDLVLRIVARLDDTYELVVNALEFSITAQELDDALVAALAKAGSEVTAQHLRTCAQLKARKAHAQLLRPLGPGLAPYTRSRLAYAAFKLAMTPLRATGLGTLVVVLDRGFDVLRGLDNVEKSFDELIANNQIAIDALYRA